MKKYIIKIIKNKYWLLGGFVMLWILFFDKYNVIQQFKLHNQITKLEEDKAFYESEVNQMEHEKNLLETDDESLEKFAREKYLMKKDNEDLFIIVNKKNEEEE